MHVVASLAMRPVVPSDLDHLKALIDAVGLFPAEMLEGMMHPALAEGADEIWLTGGRERPAVIAYCVPERMTSGTWNLLLIAVHPERQRGGLGRAIVSHLERLLGERGARLLLVETSGLPEYERTRAFYRALGFEEEARIRDFYAAGEDKLVFRKPLG